jgi:hypothetical protein
MNVSILVRVAARRSSGTESAAVISELLGSAHDEAGVELLKAAVGGGAVFRDLVLARVI